MGSNIKTAIIPLSFVLTLVLALAVQAFNLIPVKKSVLLTFDDGPDPNHTPQILTVLQENDINAIFFVVGKQVEKHPELLTRIHTEGHVIGNHTYDHANISLLSPEALRSQVIRTDKIVAALTGTKPLYFRPPRGIITQREADILNMMGKKVILWDLGLEKKGIKDPSLTVGNLFKRLRRKHSAVLLMHDGSLGRHDRMVTVDSLQMIIDELKSRGYSFVHPKSDEALTLMQIQAIK